MSPMVADYVATLVRPDQCFNPDLASVLTAVLALRAAGQGVDVSVVGAWLAERRMLEAVGGYGRLSELVAGGTPVERVVAFHAGVVREKWLLRQLLRQADVIVEAVGDSEGVPVEEVIGRVCAGVSGVQEAMLGSAEKTLYTMKDAAKAWIDDALPLVGKRNTYRGVPSGFYQLDLLLKGFQAGEVIAIAAKPGLGKTALALQMAVQMASKRKCPETGLDKRPGFGVGFFSVEMTAPQLTARLLTSASRLAAGHVRTPQNWQTSDVERLTVAAENLAGLPIWIETDGNLTPEKFRARARWMVQQGAEILFLDYLQLMTLSEKPKGDYDMELTRQGSEAVRQAAKELEVPIVMLLQFNKEGIRSGIPSMADIKGSGKILQDAHTIIVMHEVETDRTEGQEQEIQLTVVKAREAERGVYRRLAYHGATYTFKEQQSHSGSGAESYKPRIAK